MSDPILHYLKSIDDRTARMEIRIDETLDKHQDKLNEHDKKFERQKGLMVGGGAVIAFIGACIGWVLDHLRGA